MIHCIGNSHVNTFSNSPHLNLIFRNDFFCSHHIGPVTAYSFRKKHLIKVWDYIYKSVSKTDYIIIIAGEVDCRLHLPQKADELKIPDETMVINCMKEFFPCIKEIKEKGFKILSFGTHPTTTQKHNMSDINNPIYSSPERRNNICLIWNKELQKLSIENNIPFFSIYNHLVNNKNQTLMEYFIDYCHIKGSLVYKFIIDKLKMLNVIQPEN